jgi:hypothetical protein
LSLASFVQTGAKEEDEYFAQQQFTVFEIEAGAPVWPGILDHATCSKEEVLLPHGTLVELVRILSPPPAAQLILPNWDRWPQARPLSQSGIKILSSPPFARPVLVYRLRAAVLQPEQELAVLHQPLAYGLYASCLEEVGAQLNPPLSGNELREKILRGEIPLTSLG